MRTRKQATPAQRGCGLFLVSTILVAVFGVMGASRTITHFAGEAATAHVDRCEEQVQHRRKSRTRTTITCYGTWTTADGRRRSGEIEGAGRSDEGNDVAVRTSGGDAQLDDPIVLWPVACFLIALVGAVGAGFWALRQWSKGSGPPSVA